jgi:hypothetical protein
VDTGPTDWLHDAEKPRSSRFVAEETDIHGWTPFEVTHPECFAAVAGADALASLVAAAEPPPE